MSTTVIPSQPVFVIDLTRLKDNLENVQRLKTRTGCKILLATKAFAMPVAFDLMREYLDGTTASGEYEARLGAEEFSKEVHVYSPAYTKSEIEKLSRLANYIYFNSVEQLNKFARKCRSTGCKIGLRVNPKYSRVAIGGSRYDPCLPGSRFGEVEALLKDVNWELVDSLYVHALCEAMHGESVGLIEHIAKNFREYIREVETVNFGGGHFLNHPRYDLDALIDGLNAFKNEYNVSVTLEPGAGLVVKTGELESTVVAIHRNEIDTAIINASAATHMPDVLETPYTPEIVDAQQAGKLAYTYRIAGRTCLASDIFGDYSFDQPLTPGSKIVFSDQMHYSFVKSNNFNGTPPANFAVRHENGKVESIAEFSYQDFKRHLGFKDSN